MGWFGFGGNPTDTPSSSAEVSAAPIDLSAGMNFSVPGFDAPAVNSSGKSTETSNYQFSARTISAGSFSIPGGTRPRLGSTEICWSRSFPANDTLCADGSLNVCFSAAAIHYAGRRCCWKGKIRIRARTYRVKMEKNRSKSHFFFIFRISDGPSAEHSVLDVLAELSVSL